MPQSLSSLIVHVIFSTKDREKWIGNEIRSELFGYLSTCCRDLGWECYRVGGVSDHVHLAIRQPRDQNVSDLVGHVKRTSSKWMSEQGAQYVNFSWQRGYGAFSIGASQLDELLHYIDGQEEHHRVKTFQEEYRAFLRKYAIDYDEKYVWD